MVFFAVNLVFQVATILRVLLRPQREPAARMAWVVVILLAPVVGIAAYFLFGEIDVGRARRERLRAAIAGLPPMPMLDDKMAPTLGAEAGGDAADAADTDLRPVIPHAHVHLFRVGTSISGFLPVGGNRGQLMADSDATIDAMVADIDAARETVHLVFYIWLTDTNGMKIVEALKRAAGRGVAVRAMADDLGSRHLIRSKHWLDMEAAGVRLARALPIDNVLFQLLRQRIDLRNHRKIVVVDNWITYCGSQNAADAAFSPKPRFAPWVDVMVRFEGPVARQNQMLFAGDWLGHVDDDLDAVLTAPLVATGPGFAAQVIAAGPTLRNSAMPEIFEALMYAADHELVVTTPYFVPNEPLLSAICAAGRRGVDTRLIVPERNDSWVVAAASHSYYADLRQAGVRIFEYRDGLLHAKLLTLDGEVALLGSANIDRRSFQLNYENNILLHDRQLADDLRGRQEEYLARSREVLLDEVMHWSRRRRIWNNTIAMFGPVL